MWFIGRKLVKLMIVARYNDNDEAVLTRLESLEKGNDTKRHTNDFDSIETAAADTLQVTI